MYAVPRMDLGKRKKFNTFIHKWDLPHCWRERNKDKKEFTWSRGNPFITRRLDYLFCNSHLISDVSTTEILHFPLTDHRAVVSEFLENDFPKGPPRWQFNASYLKDTNFVKHIDSFIIYPHFGGYRA